VGESDHEASAEEQAQASEGEGKEPYDDDEEESYDVEEQTEIESALLDTTIRQVTFTSAPQAYQVAKSPWKKHVSTTYLSDHHGCYDFIQQLNAFGTRYITNLNPTGAHNIDHFDLYNSITLLLPHMPHVSDSKRISISRLQAVPSAPKKSGRGKPSPPRFDTALIMEDIHQKYRGGLRGAL
jgi:hypothetical protein